MLESPSEPVKKDVGETTTIGKDQLQRKTKERKGRLKVCLYTLVSRKLAHFSYQWEPTGNGFSVGHNFRAM